MRVKLLISLVAVLLVMPGNGTLWSQSYQKQSGKVHLNSASGEPSSTLVNINNISMWIRSDGWSARDPFTFSAGTIFPRQTSNIIFQDGVIWGGQVNDGNEPVIRVGGQTYSIGTVAGRILSPGVAEDPFAPDVRIWRIRKDYATADLTLDALELGLDVATVRSQYETDWAEWPWEKGAPWTGLDNIQDAGYLALDGVTVLGAGNGVLDRGEDSNSNGILDAGEDANGNGVLDGEFPGIEGADQVVWTVANDLDQAAVRSLYGSPSIGLEMQLTLWGYNVSGPLSNVIFKRYRLIYKGTDLTPATAFIDSMYLCQWSDPDIGDFTDDLVGSDTTLSLGYVYNGSPTDAEYSTFGLQPPAAGYDLLQGPIVPSAGNTAIFDFKKRPGFRNLPMTTFAFFYSGGIDSDPTLGGDYNGTLQWWNLLRGFRPRPESPPAPWIDPTTGQITKFLVPGDPVTGTGWIDSNPAEHRLLLASGPFTMALGDTQEVVIGLMAALGESYLLSINELKEIDRATQALFDNRFVVVLASLDVSAFFESPTETRVFISATVSQPAMSVGVTLTDATGNTVGFLTLFDDGTHNDGAAGDGVFANELTLMPQQTPLDINVIVQTASGTFEFEKFKKVTTAGPMEISGFMVASDHINSDDKINPGENIRLTASLHNGSTFDFSQVTAFFAYTGPVDFRDDIDQIFSNVNAGQTVDGLYDPADANTYTSFQVSQNAQGGDTIRVNITMTDLLGNRWDQRLVLEVKAFEIEPGEQTTIDHVSGTGDGDFSFRIVDPNLVTGHIYEIQIIEPFDENDVHGFDLVDLDESETLLSDHPLPDEFSHNIPVTDGLKLFGVNFITEVVTFRSAVQTVDADPSDPGLTLWSDAMLFGAETGLNSELNGLTAPGIDTLKRDLELRFTGVTAGGTIDEPVLSGGQWATQWERASFGEPDLTGFASVGVRLPFELWDVEYNRQVNVAVINRNADGLSPYGDGVGDTNTTGLEPRWRITGRDYFIPIMSDYDETAAMNGQIGHTDQNATWLLFFRQGGSSIWTTGDVFKIEYPNPLTSEDVYRFSVITDVEEMASNVKEFHLFQNYPNPFNPETSIRYEVPTTSKITLEIFNILGQKLKTLLDEKKTPGQYSVIWDGTNELGHKVSSGLYIYRLKGDGFVKNRKMILLK